jgi:membrane-associated protease RseP (regulator of RpoE activity)
MILRRPLLRGALCAAFLTGLIPAYATDGAARGVLRDAAAALGTTPQSGALYEQGSITMAGQTGRYSSWLDFSNGQSIAHLAVGPLVLDSGYDGEAWTALNGSTTVNNLPGQQAENVTNVYLARNEWASPTTGVAIEDAGTAGDAGRTYRRVRIIPSGGVPVTMWFDTSTHLLGRTDFEGDGGTVIDHYSDYRSVAGLRVAFRDVTQRPNGTIITTVATTAAIRPLPSDALARTPPVERGSIAGAPAPVPFRLSYGSTGNIVLPVSIAGRAPVPMVFDTGGRNVLTPQGAQALGFAGSGGLDIGGVGSSAERAGIANVGTIAAGNATLTGQQALVLPLPYALSVLFPGETVDGLIGFEMLSNFQTTIDYAKQTMTFASFADPLPPPANAAVLHLLSDGSTPYVEAEIDGVKGLFEMDTGNAGSIVIFKSFADAHGLFRNAKTLTYVSAGGVGGQLTSQSLRARSFTLAGATMQAPVLELTDQKAGAFSSRTVAGNVGAQVLRRFTIQLNFRDATGAFAPNAHLGDPFWADRTGLSLSRVADGFDVLAVTPGTPAAAAGIMGGDRIVAADGTPVASLSAARMYELVCDPSVQTIRFSVVRKGATAPVDVTVTPRTLL